MRYDVIVVGAGPAGCAAAYDLAATGRRVLLLDRRRFPRVKPCAGGLTTKTLRRLRYPVDAVVRQLCSDVVIGKRLGPTTTVRGGETLCAMTVRAEFDDYCLRRTMERGAEFRVTRHIAAISEHTHEVIVETDGATWRSSYVVGADGANSVVRRLVRDFGPLARGFAIEAQVATATPPPMQLDLGAVEFGYGWLFPKADHVNVGLYTNAADVRPDRDELAAYAHARLGATVLEHVVGHHVGLRGWSGKVATARVLLVGDAAGLVDPLLGEGIHNAVASGQAAAAAIMDAETRGTQAGALYEHEVLPVLQDVRSSWRDATTFYGHVDLAYRVLKSRHVAARAMRGYAGASTAWRHRWWLVLPVVLGSLLRIRRPGSAAGSATDLRAGSGAVPGGPRRP